MSTYISPLSPAVDSVPRDIRIVFVCADFNPTYTHRLLEDNSTYLQNLGFQNIHTVHVPGAFELPGMVARLCTTATYDLVITLGVVVRGDTPHFDYVCSEAARGIMDLTLAYDTPIIFGVLTCENIEQVEARMWYGFSVAGLNLISSVYSLS